MPRVVIDPVTRIEGHLRIEAQVEAGAVTQAWSSGTMFRGIEVILRGRDPREAWLWAQRICGCSRTQSPDDAHLRHTARSVRSWQKEVSGPAPSRWYRRREVVAKPTQSACPRCAWSSADRCPQCGAHKVSTELSQVRIEDRPKTASGCTLESER